MKMLLAFSFLAVVAPASPILMTGSGSWEFSQGDGTFFSVGASGAGATLSFTGTGAGDWQDLTSLFGGTVNCGFGCEGSGFAAIGTTESSYFQFDLNGPDSTLTLYSDKYGNNEIASADLVAYLQVTSEQIDWRNGQIDWSKGTFAVLPEAPIPEPGTAWLAVLGVAALLCARLWRSTHKAALAAARRT